MVYERRFYTNVNFALEPSPQPCLAVRYFVRIMQVLVNLFHLTNIVPHVPNTLKALLGEERDNARVTTEKSHNHKQTFIVFSALGGAVLSLLGRVVLSPPASF